jgi:hypothetical protein
MSERNEDPSEGSPLRYRERIYVVPEGTDVAAAEAVLRARFAELERDLADVGPGRFVSLAVFDHPFIDQPVRPPLVTLQWKDWRGDAVIEYPQGDRAARRDAGPANAEPPATPDRRPPSDDPDQRIATAFEACQDLLFLSTPLEALDFTAKLLSDLLPCDAITCALYDINRDELRIASVTGPGAEERRGETLPTRRGLSGASVAKAGSPIRIDDVRQDGRFDPETEGRAGFEVTSALSQSVYSQGRLLGLLLLLDERSAAFSETDADLLAYVGDQLGAFLHQARASVRPRP